MADFKVQTTLKIDTTRKHDAMPTVKQSAFLPRPKLKRNVTEGSSSRKDVRFSINTNPLTVPYDGGVDAPSPEFSSSDSELTPPVSPSGRLVKSPRTKRPPNSTVNSDESGSSSSSTLVGSSSSSSTSPTTSKYKGLSSDETEPVVGAIYLPGQPLPRQSQHRALDRYQEWEANNAKAIAKMDPFQRWSYYVLKMEDRRSRRFRGEKSSSPEAKETPKGSSAGTPPLERERRKSLS
ncbi:hypothetical protein FRC02_006133 [Tulasnella sp. 418]|nr:hypothetical protein FRC02_006133 [Tulasnella sp. 418]